MSSGGITLYELQQTTAADPLLSKVVGFVHKHWPPKSKISDQLKLYYLVHSKLSVENGCLIHDSQVIAPTMLWQRILQLGHLRHPGVTQMKHKLCESYWWPGLSEQIDELVAHCNGCQYSEKSTPPANAPLSLSLIQLTPGVKWGSTSLGHLQMHLGTSNTL